MLAKHCNTPKDASRVYITSALQVNRCLSIKGAEDVINKPFAFEISTTDSSMYFVADKDKVTKEACHCA